MNIKLPELSNLSSRKKQVYPTKRTMNLYYRVDKTTRPATVALYAIFGAVVLLAIIKILFLDLWLQTTEVKDHASQLQTTLTSLQNDLKDYEYYSRYGATDDELLQVDRIEILSLIESCTGSTARMQAITVTESVISLKIADMTLADVSLVVRALENSGMVSDIQVQTAATNDKNSGSEKVNATMTITLKPTEAAASAAAAQNTNEATNTSSDNPSSNASKSAAQSIADASKATKSLNGGN